MQPVPDRYQQSRAHHQRAQQHLPGGVSSAIRAGQLPVPISFVSGQGSHLTDLDGNDYIDYALGYGPMLLGHSPPAVIAAVERQLATGIQYGASHEIETRLAEAVCRTVPSADGCILASTGSDAVLVALRIARAATGRIPVVKFAGHFHGWPDPLGIGTPGHPGREPGSGGQDPLASQSVVVCPWNDAAALAEILKQDVAAVIMEPIAVNGGCFLPAAGYLEAVRRLCDRSGAVLIFDEVITGYRLALGGAQERFGVTPDLTILGKAMGSGFPISAVCGRSDLMELVASGQVAHLGTFNGHPVCAAASLAAIEELERTRHDVYPRLEDSGRALAEMLRTAANDAGLPLWVNQLGATGYAFWSETPVLAASDVSTADGERYRRFAAALLDEGVHVIPRGLLYVSTAHTDADLEATSEGIHRAAQRCAAEPSLP